MINGNYVLPVYVIVTQLKGLQKCSCGRKIYIIIEKCGLTGQSFNRWGCSSSTAPKRAGKWKLVKVSESFLYPEGTIPWAEHGKKPQTGPTPFSCLWNLLPPPFYLLHHQRFYPLKIIWSCHESGNIYYRGTKCFRLFIGPKANTSVLPHSQGWDFFIYFLFFRA